MIKLEETTSNVNVLAEDELTKVVGGCGGYNHRHRHHHHGRRWYRYEGGSDNGFEDRGSSGSSFDRAGSDPGSDASGSSDASGGDDTAV